VIRRLWAVIRLHPETFRTIADDPAATRQAVAIAGLAVGLSQISVQGSLVGRVVLGALGGVIGLVVWTGVLFVAGRLVGGTARYIGLLRCVGFSAVPFMVARVRFVGIAALVLTCAIQVMAVREVQRVSNGQALASVLVPWAVLVGLSIAGAVALLEMMR
jgi:hypothetical protein